MCYSSLLRESVAVIKRDLALKIQDLARGFPVIAILGPRQSGKTTLAQATFAQHRYVTLEDLSIREYASSDPRGFIEECRREAHGVIIDEAQHVPALFSYIQVEVDRQYKPGFFVLTGSQNFLLNQNISQSLAGRVALLTLLPLSIGELERAGSLHERVEQALFTGWYPRVYAHAINPTDWYRNYINTYIERDVRNIEQVVDLSLFQTFVKLCAGRIGQILDLVSLANDCGIDFKTARAWMSVLEASYIVFQLQPYYKNFSKRLIKSPKLYFYDSGVAATLLGITSPEQLATHYLRGGLMESMVIADIVKQRHNRGMQPNCYFWRDDNGNEVDCLIEDGLSVIAVEVKAGKTITTDQLRGLISWSDAAQTTAEHNVLVYAGDEGQQRSQARIISWRQLSQLVDHPSS